MKLLAAVIIGLLHNVRQCIADPMPYWAWYLTSEEIASYENGKVPSLACPLGTYRNFRSGIRQDGCIPCPPGRYGSSIYLASPECTGACPRGTYLDMAGGKSVEDCRPCPRGTYGDTVGLATRECSGRCSDLNTAKVKYYGSEEGLTSKSGCSVCHEALVDVNGQCNNKEATLKRYLSQR